MYRVPAVKLFGGRLLDYVKESGQEVPRVVTSCVRTINLHGFYHQGIFRVPGVQTDLQNLQVHLLFLYSHTVGIQNFKLSNFRKFLRGYLR